MAKRTERYANFRKYLEQQAAAKTTRGSNLLCLVAARAKVSESELQDIVDGGEISDDIANALALLLNVTTEEDE